MFIKNLLCYILCTFSTLPLKQLYNAKLDQILHDRFLWVSPIATNEALITSVETDTYIEETIIDRMNHMSVEASLKVSLFAGLIEVSLNVSKLKCPHFFLYLKAGKSIMTRFMFFRLCISCTAS